MIGSGVSNSYSLLEIFDRGFVNSMVAISIASWNADVVVSIGISDRCWYWDALVATELLADDDDTSVAEGEATASMEYGVVDAIIDAGD